MTRFARLQRRLAGRLQPQPFDCGCCRDLGWVLERADRAPLKLDLIECPVPDCAASGQEVAKLRILTAPWDDHAVHAEAARRFAAGTRLGRDTPPPSASRERRR
jgi:hypothetical protein